MHCVRCLRKEVSVVRVVQVRVLSSHPGQDRVGRVRGDLTVGTEDLAGDLKDHGVEGHLLKDPALVPKALKIH